MKYFRKQIILSFSFLFLVNSLILAERYTISGYVSDITSGETLIAAAIYDTYSGQGTVTNSYGFYSLSLPEGEVNLEYSYVGYSRKQVRFTLTKDTVLNMRMETSTVLKEVIVTGRSELGVRGSQMGAIEVPIAQIKKVPTLFGENDLLKALQLLPGVQAGTEGAAGLYVRGGGPDENLLLLDGIPVYNVNHMMGFFSVFNSDAIKNVTLYKGAFPARFGGRLSSVVDIRMKDGNEKEIKGNFSIGLISSKIQLEGPIIKDKTTFNISARRTYLDILAQPIIRAQARAEGGGDDKLNAGYYFYDVNAKFTHKLSDKDKLYLSAYLGDDKMYSKLKTSDKFEEGTEEKTWMKMNWNWGNTVAALRWNHVVSQRLFMNTTASFTQYRSLLGVGSEVKTIIKTDKGRKTEKDEFMMNYNSGIYDWTVKTDFDYEPVPSHKIKFGTNYTYHSFSPDVYSMKINTQTETNPINLDTVVGAPKVYSHETMTYLEDNISIGKFLKLNAGLHFSTFHVQKENYYSLQPRLGLRVMLAENLSLKAGYASMKQYVHLLSNNNISLPTDLWVPVTKRIKPMQSHQVALGAFYTVKELGNFSIEGYYKTMDNLLEYKDGASFMGSSTNWEDKVSMGRGIAYGVELLYQRSFGKTTGWIGYTWSKADRIFDKPGNIINNGEKFPAKYDRRHDISLTIAHTFSEKFDIAGSWVYSSGNTGTFGFQEYYYFKDESKFGSTYPTRHTYVEKRNNYRFNGYHRLDIGVNFHKKTKRGNKATWNISIYNAYNQLNPFMVGIHSDYNYNPKTQKSTEINKLMQFSLFPIIPSVSYSLSF